MSFGVGWQTQKEHATRDMAEVLAARGKGQQHAAPTTTHTTTYSSATDSATTDDWQQASI